MKILIGTSGWSYNWNLKRRLDWYVEKSGLNAIELNSSFYSFPTPHMVENWRTAGNNLSWCIKINRSITHFSRMRAGSFKTFVKFLKLFEPLEEIIAYYLFQLPPAFQKESDTIKNLETFVERFSEKRKKLAFEFRHATWFSEETVRLMKKLGCVLVSVDAPDSTGFPYDIYSVKDRVYLRMYGRTNWYSHRYAQEELKETAEKIVAANPKVCHILFNNDTDMLGDAREMRKIMSNAQ